MKTALILQSMLIVTLYAHTAYAITYYSRVNGPRQSENTKRTGSIDVPPEEKQARMARRDALAKSKSITYSKVEIPKGAAFKPKDKRGWTFSVELVDATLRDLDVEPPNSDRSKKTVEGADVL